MDDLERLCILRDVLNESRLSTAISLGKLANQVESLIASIDDVPNDLRQAFAALWAGLEVVGVQHQEAGTEPTAAELADLRAMADRLRRETDAEIGARGS